MPSEPDSRVVRLRHRDSILLDRLDKLHRALFDGVDIVPGQFMDFVTQRLGDETMLLILGMDGETAVGYALAFDVAEHPFMPEWGRSGYVTQLFVASEHRRRGIGKLLVDSITQWLASRGVGNVLLNVSPGNEGGRLFWQRLGFVAHQIRMRREIET